MKRKYKKNLVFICGKKKDASKKDVGADNQLFFFAVSACHQLQLINFKNVSMKQNLTIDYRPIVLCLMICFMFVWCCFLEIV